MLLDSVTWQIDDRERVGLSGPNGAGKTTLLKMLAGIDEPDGGLIVKPAGLTIGYLPQDGLVYSGRTLREEASLAFKPLLDMKAEIAALEDRLGRRAGLARRARGDAVSRYSELQDEFRRSDGYTIELKVTTVLRGLGFSDEDMEKKTETFSGGWQMRIALARLLLGRPGLLLLDEPTNHLDLDARNWLEEYLSDYPHAVILVSHDRFFLDAVVTRITEIGMRTLTDYVGNYSAYIKERDARMERLRQQKHDQDEEIERMQAFINRFRYQATKASQVQSRIKMLDKVVRIEIPPERKRVRFHFPQCAKSGRMVMELKHVRKAYGDDARVRRRQPAHRARRPDRAGRPERRRQVDADADAVGRGNARHRRARRRAPDGDAVLRAGRSGASWIRRGPSTRRSPATRRSRWCRTSGRSSAASCFRGTTSRSRCACCRAASARGWPSRACCSGPANTLLLDEPTNHLDLDSKDVLLDALEDFGGTLDLRLARSLLRRQAGDQDHRDRPRRRVGVSGDLRRVPVEQEESRSDGRGASRGARRPGSGLRMRQQPRSGLELCVREGTAPRRKTHRPDLTPAPAQRRPDPEAGEAVLRRQEEAGRRGSQGAKGSRSPAAPNR